MATGKIQKFDVVTAIGVKVVKKEDMQRQFPQTWPTQVIYGIVRGKGTGNKWMVDWNLNTFSVSGEHGARSLTLYARPNNVSGNGQNPAQSVQPVANAAAATDQPSTDDSDEDESSEDDDDGQPAPVPAVPGAPVQNDPLLVDGVKWTPQPDGVTGCYRARDGVASKNPHIKWPRGLRKDPALSKNLIDYFYVMFPDMIESICMWTSKNLKKPVTPHELVKFFGICTAMTLQPCRNREEYWRELDSGLFPPLNFGKRFKMGRDRFNDIMRELTLHPPETDTSDPWYRVRHFVQMINERRKECFIPGDVICIDESSCKWCGLGDWYEPGLPHITKCSRKPWNLAMEYKDAMDAETQIMLRMVIMEGKQVMDRRNAQEYPRKKAGTAMVLRLTEPWHGSFRQVVGDSYFASVECAVECKKKDLYFTGLVKTSSKMFPKQYLQNEVQFAFRGETKTFTATVDGHDIIAHVWNDPGKPGKPRKALITTCGTSTLTDPVQRPRKRRLEDGTWETFYREIPRTNIVAHYFTWAGAIDRGNRQRMDDLRMEVTLEFKRWWLRVNTSFLAVIIVDTINAWQFFEAPGSFRTLVTYLCQQMVNNNLRGCPSEEVGREMEPGVTREFWQATASEPVQRYGKVARGKTHAARAAGMPNHEILPIRTIPEYAESRNAKLTCRVCKHADATLYCKTCGRNDHNQILALCNPSTKRQCCMLHAQT